jgi:predicted nucleic acid-binding protein
VRLVDTSSWIEYLRDTTSEVGDRVEKLILSGHAAWCEIVALELSNGIKFEQKAKLARLERLIPSLEIDQRVWNLSRKLAMASRADGITVPIGDLIVAACARVHGVQIDHKGDDHFEMLSSIPA